MAARGLNGAVMTEQERDGMYQAREGVVWQLQYTLNRGTFPGPDAPAQINSGMCQCYHSCNSELTCSSSWALPWLQWNKFPLILRDLQQLQRDLVKKSSMGCSIACVGAVAMQGFS